MEHTPTYDYSNYMQYLETAVLRNSIEKTVHALRNLEFDAVAFRGTSGLLVGPSVAIQLNKSMILVRKQSELNGNSHSNKICEGDRGARTYIIVDDFISAGSTARTMHYEIKLWAPEAKCLGLMQYRWLCWADESDKSKGLNPETTRLRLRHDFFPSDYAAIVGQ